MTKLLALWSGDLALNEAFWIWRVTVGLLVNIVTSILFLVMTLQDQPLAAMLVGDGLSVPYNPSQSSGSGVRPHAMAVRRSMPNLRASRASF
jgi:hypothetical protein